MEYTIDLVKEPNPRDDRIEKDARPCGSIRLRFSISSGPKMGFETTTLRSGFTFHNPEPDLGLRLRRIGELQAADLAELARQREGATV